mmetsp:Transcript_8985/g.33055  ORF Transcript_8985/g.33055 Transcript_8985/m.33055 type:complete len:397 (+) Transcript_8985:429-1619(+)
MQSPDLMNMDIPLDVPMDTDWLNGGQDDEALEMILAGGIDGNDPALDGFTGQDLQALDGFDISQGIGDADLFPMVPEDELLGKVSRSKKKKTKVDKAKPTKGTTKAQTKAQKAKEAKAQKAKETAKGKKASQPKAAPKPKGGAGTSSQASPGTKAALQAQKKEAQAREARQRELERKDLEARERAQKEKERERREKLRRRPPVSLEGPVVPPLGVEQALRTRVIPDLRTAAAGLRQFGRPLDTFQTPPGCIPDLYRLHERMKAMAASMGLEEVPEDSALLLSWALEYHMKDIIERTIKAGITSRCLSRQGGGEKIKGGVRKGKAPVTPSAVVKAASPAAATGSGSKKSSKSKAAAAAANIEQTPLTALDLMAAVEVDSSILGDEMVMNRERISSLL